MPHIPQFSVMTVTLNNRDGLARTHASLERQTCTDFEWVVVDGGSHDDTADYMKNVREATFISEPDQGIYDAMNKGMLRARGHYLLFLNAGDELAAADVLEAIQSASAQNSAPDFIYGDALERMRTGACLLKRARSHTNPFSGMFTHHQAMLYKRTALEGFSYDLRWDIAADYDLTMRFLKHGARALYIERPLCIFESGGVSQARAGLGRQEQYRIRREAGVLPPVLNEALYVFQFSSWHIRRLFPALYWMVRRIWPPRF